LHAILLFGLTICNSFALFLDHCTYCTRNCTTGVRYASRARFPLFDLFIVY